MPRRHPAAGHRRWGRCLRGIPGGRRGPRGHPAAVTPGALMWHPGGRRGPSPPASSSGGAGVSPSSPRDRSGVTWHPQGVPALVPHPCPEAWVSQGRCGSPVSPSCPPGSNAPPAAASRTSTSTPSSATSTPRSPAAPRAAMGTVAPGHPAAPAHPGEPLRPPVRTRGTRPPSHPPSPHHPKGL